MNSSSAAERVRQALLKSGGIEEHDAVEYLKKINSRRIKGPNTKALMIKAKTMKNYMDKNLRVRASRRHQPSMRMIQNRPEPINLFSHVNSIYQSRLGDYLAKRRPGLERILANLEAEGASSYEPLVKSPKQWIIDPLPELNILSENSEVEFVPQYLLGVGGQGCVLGVNIGERTYAVKFRIRQKKTSLSSKRRSPSFRKRG